MEFSLALGGLLTAKFLVPSARVSHTNWGKKGFLWHWLEFEL